MMASFYNDEIEKLQLKLNIAKQALQQVTTIYTDCSHAREIADQALRKIEEKKK